MNVLHPSSCLPTLPQRFLENCSNIKLPRNISRECFWVEREKEEVRASEREPQSEPGLLRIQAESDPRVPVGRAGSQDVHTQAKPCRASQPGRYLPHRTC